MEQLTNNTSWSISIAKSGTSNHNSTSSKGVSQNESVNDDRDDDSSVISSESNDDLRRNQQGIVYFIMEIHVFKSNMNNNITC